MLSTVNLEKEHFRLITDYFNGRNQAIQIIHPDFIGGGPFPGRGGWVLFFEVMTPNSIDTKVEWFAVGIIRGQTYGGEKSFPNSRSHIRKSGQQRFPELKYVTKTGMVVDSPPSQSFNIDPKTLIQFACKNANLGGHGCCQQLPRSSC